MECKCKMNENLNVNENMIRNYFRDLDDIAEEFILEKIVKSRNPETSQVGELFLQDLVTLSFSISSKI